DLDTTDRAGDRVLYVVADAAQEVAESREDDNTAVRPLHVDGLLADLVLTPGDVVADPNPPQEGETLTLRVNVHNEGQRAAAAGVLAVFDGNPRLSGRLIGQLSVPSLGVGGAASLSLSWNTAGLRGSHNLYFEADAQYAVYESNELNNEVQLAIEVT